MAVDTSKIYDSNGISELSDEAIKELIESIDKVQLDFLVSDTIVGNWRIRRWNSGYCEMEATTGNYTLDVTTAWGSVFYAEVGAISYPIILADIPKVFVTIAKGHPCEVIAGVTSVSANATPSLRVMRPVSTSGAIVAFNVLVKGRWK
ncbi:hypothetical protein AOC36_09505 [Erysipelothrix larvae]|uniref:BppU N-terminal domain-containing protein n=1 Tax=Erysipelothrix larvae TaxID=1514105 RepID=A0A0X8H163_9FIRM|nr:hypothetical protein [Erysipelothrix larvae]AMC94209.1 hypothetical protein AOC36_09505 [Erysipelothrix larvae]